MPVRLISMDESGNTGGDLLNPDQPVYVLASSQVGDAVARGLLTDAGFPVDREAHFYRARRSSRGQRRILQLLDTLSEDQARVSAVHKRYMVFAKITDDLLDSALYEQTGEGLYARGAHRSTANVLYFTMAPLLGKEETLTFLERFVAMCRATDHRSIEKFFATTRHLASRSDPGLRPLLELLLSSRERIHDFLPAEYPLDPSLTTFVAHAREWGRDRSLALVINYDQSRVMQGQNETLQRACDPARPATVIGHGDRSLHLPLPVHSLNFVTSEQHPAVQLADIVASATGFWLREELADNRSNFGQSLGPLVKPFLYDVVWPDPDSIGTPDTDNFPPGSDPAAAAARWFST